MVNLKELLESAAKVVERRKFGEGDMGFEVELRLIARPDMEEMRNRCIKKVATRMNGVREMRDELDIKKLREYIAESILTNWTGLTVGKVLHACNRSAPAGTDLKKAVEFNTENAIALLSTARGEVQGILMSFDDWVWNEALTLSEEHSDQEAREKKD